MGDTRQGERKNKRERLVALRNKVKHDKHLVEIDERAIKRKERDENVFPRLNGLRENAENVFSCRGLGLAQNKKEVNQ